MCELKHKKLLVRFPKNIPISFLLLYLHLLFMFVFLFLYLYTILKYQIFDLWNFFSEAFTYISYITRHKIVGIIVVNHWSFKSLFKN